MGSVGKNIEKTFNFMKDRGADAIGGAMSGDAETAIAGGIGATGANEAINAVKTTLLPNPAEDVATNMPSYMLDTEAAKRRKRALALQRGLMSTRRSMGEAGEDVSTLTPTFQGKQKLGQ